jgi:hypothetical protein
MSDASAKVVCPICAEETFCDGDWTLTDKYAERYEGECGTCGAQLVVTATGPNKGREWGELLLAKAVKP